MHNTIKFCICMGFVSLLLMGFTRSWEEKQKDRKWLIQPSIESIEHRLKCLEREMIEHNCTSIIHGTQDRPEYPCPMCKGTLHNPNVVNNVVFWWCARCGHRTLVSKLSDSIGPEWRDIWKAEKK
jgi:hypothetical protein